MSEQGEKEQSRGGRGVSFEARGRDRVGPEVAGQPMEIDMDAVPEMLVSVIINSNQTTILKAILDERHRQKRRFGFRHDERHNAQTWAAILAEHVGKFAAESIRIGEDFRFEGAPAVPRDEVLERELHIILAVGFAYLEAKARIKERRVR